MADSKIHLEPAQIEWMSDGTPRSRQFDDIYFSTAGGLDESEHVYLRGNQLETRWQTHFSLHTHFLVAEAGFGTGLNFLLTARKFAQHRPNVTDAQLIYYAIEKYPLPPADLQRVLSQFPSLTSEAELLQNNYPQPIRGWHRLAFSAHTTLILIFDDVSRALAQLRTNRILMDAWYLDGFSPANNGEMWSSENMATIGRLCRSGATASSFSAASQVRSRLTDAGFDVRKTQGFGRKRDMTVARLREQRPDHRTDYRTVPDKASAIAIIGAGIAGCATANALAQRGFTVDIYDADNQPGGVLTKHPQALAAPHWTRDLALPTRVQLQGFLQLRSFISQFAAELKICESALELMDKTQADDLSRCLGPFMQWLNAEQASVTAGVPVDESAAHMKLALAVNPGELCVRLLTLANIKFLCGEKIRWQTVGQSIHIHRAGADFEYQNVILCNGSAMAELPASMTSSFFLQKIRGQLSVIRANERSAGLKLPLRYGGYLMPDANATGIAAHAMHCIGATSLRDSDNTQLCEADHRQNWMQLRTKLPSLTQDWAPQFIAGSAGIRLSTRDHLPLSGKHPDHPGLWLNCAHGSHGLMTAFVGAELIAAALSGEPPTLPADIIKAVAPERFRRRDSSHQLDKSVLTAQTP